MSGHDAWRADVLADDGGGGDNDLHVRTIQTAIRQTMGSVTLETLAGSTS